MLVKANIPKLYSEHTCRAVDLRPFLGVFLFAKGDIAVQLVPKPEADATLLNKSLLGASTGVPGAASVTN